MSVRSPVVDISTLGQKQMTFAYGDVFTLPSDKTFDFSSKSSFLFLVGRTFSADAPRKITLKVGKGTTKFIFYATEAQKPLTVVFTKNDQELGTYPLTPDAINIGVTISFLEKPDDITGEPAGMSKKLLPLLGDSIQNEPVLVRFLETQLRVAAITMFTYPKLSLSILLFICRLTLQSKVAAVTHFEASTIMDQLLADLQHSGDLNVCFVPSVTMSVYESTIIALLESASAYSTQYDRFIDKKDDSAARHQATLVMVEQNKDALVSQAQLLAQAQTSWDDAMSAMETAQINAKVDHLAHVSTFSTDPTRCRQWRRKLQI